MHNKFFFLLGKTTATPSAKARLVSVPQKQKERRALL